MNFWDEEKEVLAGYVKDKKLGQRVLLNGSGVGKESYGVQGIPVVYWIDRNGVVVDMHFDFDGPGPLEKKTRKLLDRTS